MKALAPAATFVCLSLLAQAADAQDRHSVELAFQRAIANCMTNYQDPRQVPQAFRASGFGVGRDAEGDLAEGQGVYVRFTLDQIGGDNFCKIESPHITARRAEAIGRQLATHFFPGQVEEGAPEGAAECPTISIFAPRSLMVMTFNDAGNGGTCNGGGGASIAYKF